MKLSLPNCRYQVKHDKNIVWKINNGKVRRGRNLSRIVRGVTLTASIVVSLSSKTLFVQSQERKGPASLQQIYSTGSGGGGEGGVLCQRHSYFTSGAICSTSFFYLQCSIDPYKMYTNKSTYN